jgi:hypothetical protein
LSDAREQLWIIVSHILERFFDIRFRRTLESLAPEPTLAAFLVITSRN